MKVVLALATAVVAVLAVQAMRRTDARPKAVDVVHDAVEEAVEVEQEEEGTPARLLFEDGSPAAGIVLNLAAGRCFETRVFFNRDYPPKTIWLIVHERVATTGEDGSFAFPAVDGRAVLYTGPDSDAFVLTEFDPQAREVRARRRVTVTGVLRNAAGELMRHYPIGAQLGRPEDWRTRVSRQFDSFVTRDGDLGVDPFAKAETLTGTAGEFRLRLVEGSNHFFFGDQRRDGTLAITIPRRDHELPELRVPPPAAVVRRQPTTLHGIVLNHAGDPHAGAEVQLWAGTVGEPSHRTRTDARGRFTFRGLTSEKAIAWAISTERPHLTLPGQSSGTIMLPSNTPVILRVCEPEEYCWARPAGISGMYLFERDGVLVGGRSLDGSDTVGMPPGAYRILVITRDRRILDAPFTAPRGGEHQLPAR